MELRDLTTTLGGLRLHEASHSLPFKPPKDSNKHRTLSEASPRFLFRIFDRNSDGTTGLYWATSKDAAGSRPREDAGIDVFDRSNCSEAAEMIFVHLGRAWEKGYPDNLVSWTSSLLFALQYAFYRHVSNGTDLGDIFLCVVDTTAIPSNVFIRDIDLIRAFRQYDSHLADLLALRGRRHRDHQGSYYFGEYLSQGALKIEANCSIVPMDEIIDNGLFTLRSEFEDAASRGATWANEVIRLREVFYEETVDLPVTTQEELQAARDIADLFDDRFRIPVAASLLALKPRQPVDDDIVQWFDQPRYTSTFRSPPLAISVLTPRRLP